MKTDNLKENNHKCNCSSKNCKCNSTYNDDKNIANENKNCQCEKEKINLLEEENKKLKNDLLRSFADMENLKKRTEIDIQNNRNYVTANIVKSFIEVADNLDRAIGTYKQNKSDMSALIDGIKMINDEFIRILNNFGVEKIKSTGELFNPELHHAVSMKIPTKDEDINKIAEEIQVGYTLDGKVIKPSLVVVYKK